METHIPICTTEILQNIPTHSKYFLDATFGRGGHTQAILNHFPNSRITAIDLDFAAISYAQKYLHSFIQNEQLRLFHQSFFDIDNFLENHQFDVILADLGVSSPQFDDPKRGFSMYHDGPLDMRMNQQQSLTAADVINKFSEKQLIEMFQKYGEIKNPYKVARALFRERKQNPINSTLYLSDFITQITKWRKKGQHPATSYFRALRIVVNNELDDLEMGLLSLIKHLKMQGRLFVISFHSLEDRIVKNIFRSEKSLGYPLYKKVITPSSEEQKNNPRSRSAKLRIFHRDETPKNKKYPAYVKNNPSYLPSFN